MILIDKNNVNTLWDDAIAKDNIALENIGGLKIYLPKTKFEKKDVCPYVPIHMVFDMK